MKINILTLAAVLLTFGAASVQASSRAALALAPVSPAGISSLPSSMLAPASGTGTLGNDLNPASTSHFAQFDTAKPLPVSPAMVVTLIGLFIFGLRLMGLRHAHSLAEHERHSHHGRAQMFRSLHEERSSRR